MHGRLIACCVLPHPSASQSDSTHPLFLFRNILFLHSICPRLQPCNVIAHRNPPKRQFALPHRAQGPFRPYPPRNVPPLSTVALACLSASNPRLLSTTILSYPCPSCRKNSSPRLVPNSSIIAHIQRHLLTFQSSSRGRSRPPYMDFFLPICRCHESISYETPRFGGDDILC